MEHMLAFIRFCELHRESIYEHSYILTYTYIYKRININSKDTNTRSNTNLTQLILTAQRTHT